MKGKEKEHIRKQKKKTETKLLQIKGEERLKEGEGNGEKRIKIYYVQVQTHCDECDHDVWQICTNKKYINKETKLNPGFFFF